VRRNSKNAKDKSTPKEVAATSAATSEADVTELKSATSVQSAGAMPGAEVRTDGPALGDATAPMEVDNWKHPGRTLEQKVTAAQIVNEAPATEALVKFRKYQHPVFLDRKSGILVLHWSRQIGKSYTLAAWAVDRLLAQLQRYNSWLITVLSNSKDNGAEFVIKCQDICNQLGMVMEKTRKADIIGDAAVYDCSDNSPDLTYDNMRMEVRITVRADDGTTRIGRIKVLAANPRTARGFSGDLILDEFAFHEDSNAIWEAAEPILSSNAEFVCRIASTGNGKHNMFYRMASGAGPNDGTFFESGTGFTVSRVTRSEAWKMGVKVFDPKTRAPIHPDEARKKSLDKRAYDQNYECHFTDENMALLTHELISAAERSLITIDEQEWSAASLARMFRAEGRLEAGQDFGRNRDLSVIWVIERLGQLRKTIAILRMQNMRTPAQQRQADMVCAMPKFARYELDMTGNGLGLTEYLQEKWGTWRINGVNFATTRPVNDKLMAEGRKAPTAKVTEIMATEMVAVFEDRSIEIPAEQELRDDLRKPEKIVSPGGRVSIAATRDDAGHADHFWALALAIEAGNQLSEPGTVFVFEDSRRNQTLADRRDRSIWAKTTDYGLRIANLKIWLRSVVPSKLESLTVSMTAAANNLSTSPTWGATIEASSSGGFQSATWCFYHAADRSVNLRPEPSRYVGSGAVWRTLERTLGRQTHCKATKRVLKALWQRVTKRVLGQFFDGQEVVYA